VKSSRPALSNAALGLILFIGFEFMMFAGLLSAYLIFRSGERNWPPPGLPGLPLGVTAANTAGLLLSGLTMLLALRAVRRDLKTAFCGWLALTQLLGLLFLGVQGFEWAGLVHHGFTMRSGLFGGVFYALVGLHALHVFGAVLWLCEIARRARLGRYSAAAHLGPALCAIYWMFVVGLWMLIFGLVYL